MAQVALKPQVDALNEVRSKIQKEQEELAKKNTAIFEMLNKTENGRERLKLASEMRRMYKNVADIQALTANQDDDRSAVVAQREEALSHSEQSRLAKQKKQTSSKQKASSTPSIFARPLLPLSSSSFSSSSSSAAATNVGRPSTATTTASNQNQAQQSATATRNNRTVTPVGNRPRHPSQGAEAAESMAQVAPFLGITGKPLRPVGGVVGRGGTTLFVQDELYIDEEDKLVAKKDDNQNYNIQDSMPASTALQQRQRQSSSSAGGNGTGGLLSVPHVVGADTAIVLLKPFFNHICEEGEDDLEAMPYYQPAHRAAFLQRAKLAKKKAMPKANVPMKKKTKKKKENNKIEANKTAETGKGGNPGFSKTKRAAKQQQGKENHEDEDDASDFSDEGKYDDQSEENIEEGQEKDIGKRRSHPRRGEGGHNNRVIHHHYYPSDRTPSTNRSNSHSNSDSDDSESIDSSDSDISRDSRHSNNSHNTHHSHSHSHHGEALPSATSTSTSSSSTSSSSLAYHQQHPQFAVVGTRPGPHNGPSRRQHQLLDAEAMVDDYMRPLSSTSNPSSFASSSTSRQRLPFQGPKAGGSSSVTQQVVAVPTAAEREREANEEKGREGGKRIHAPRHPPLPSCFNRPVNEENVDLAHHFTSNARPPLSHVYASSLHTQQQQSSSSNCFSPQRHPNNDGSHTIGEKEEEENDSHPYFLPPHHGGGGMQHEGGRYYEVGGFPPPQPPCSLLQSRGEDERFSQKQGSRGRRKKQYGKAYDRYAHVFDSQDENEEEESVLRAETDGWNRDASNAYGLALLREPRGDGRSKKHRNSNRSVYSDDSDSDSEQEFRRIRQQQSRGYATRGYYQEEIKAPSAWPATKRGSDYNGAQTRYAPLPAPQHHYHEKERHMPIYSSGYV